MTSVIHGKSVDVLRHFRKNPAALAVYWVYCARTNIDNVAWPGIRDLIRETGWCNDSCQDARNWLVEHKALERAEDYVRPEWRDLSLRDRQRRLNLDHSEYYRPTGTIIVKGKTYPLLYDASRDAPPVEEDQNKSSDVRRRRTSTPSNIDAIGQNLYIESDRVDSSEDLESSHSEDSSRLRTNVRIHAPEIVADPEKDSDPPSQPEQAPESDATEESNSAPLTPSCDLPPNAPMAADVVSDPPVPTKAWNDLPEELTQFQDIVHALMHVVYEVVDPAEAEVMFKALNKKSKRDQAYGRVGKIASYLRDRAAEKKLVLKKAHLSAFRHWYATSDDYGGSPPLDFEKFMMAYTKFASQHNQRTKRAQQRQPEPPAPPAAPGEAGDTWVKREDWQKQQEQPDDGRQQAAS